MSFQLGSCATDVAFPGAGARSLAPVQSDRARWMMAALPAAAITVGLFAIMNQLIHVDEVRLDPSPQRILENVVFSEPESPEPVSIRPEFDLMDIVPPPALPEVKMTPDTVGMPPLGPIGQVPSRTPIGSIVPIPTTANPVGDRTAIPVRPPVPSYPPKMAKAGLGGECMVRFNLTARGTPFDVDAQCSPAGFESAARLAVSKAEFLPRIVDGQAIETRGLSYPLEFRIKED